MGILCWVEGDCITVVAATVGHTLRVVRILLHTLVPADASRRALEAVAAALGICGALGESTTGGSREEEDGVDHVEER